MIINTNISSIVTRSYLNKNQFQLEDAMGKLSSGKRINSAGDDAAGLAISSRMQTQIRGKEVAMRNANDGISLIQTAESALGSISNILQRLRELSVQANNGTNSVTDKASLQAEISQLLDEIESIAGRTEFNGINLLNGSTATVTLHIGNESADTLSFNLEDAQRAVLGGYDTAADAPAAGGNVFLGDINVTDDTTWVGDGFTGAEVAIKVIDTALDEISSKRAEFGALQNRLEFTIDNLSTSKTNTEAARSRVEDADMAAESSNMAKQRVLVQSAVAMLSQANQSPQAILQLLQA